MSDHYWETTAQMFNSLFEKPKMTEKLLLRPPFKYLFDIIIQTSKSTGFAKDLYTEEELSSDFYDTKEKKVHFLEKAIALVSAVLNEEVEAKPGRIVAGIEPEKTNLFLQALYRAAVSGTDMGSYVQKVLALLRKEEQPVQKVVALPRKEEQPIACKEVRIGCHYYRKKPVQTTEEKVDFAEKEPTISANLTTGTSQNEVEEIQKLIQSLTQNINPLIKSLDFVDDDIEDMNKDMKYWRSQHLESKGKYQFELANTEEQLQWLQNKYAELEEQIRDRKLKIQATKSAIFQNEQRTQNHCSKLFLIK